MIVTTEPATEEDVGAVLDRAYKLASLRATHGERTVLDVDGRRIGGEHFAVIAGPCTVESRDQTLHTARAVRDAGGALFRGGAYKPRTSPYAFQGLGQEGLRVLAEAKAETGLPIVTELIDVRDIDAVLEVADVIQVGARNMQNYPLLAEIGRAGRPALLKRALSAPLDELLMAAEYILKEGNSQVILCERGIRTFDTGHRRATLDLMAVPILKELTHLPVIVDPSHAAGRRELVLPLSLAAAAAGADGIIVETHPQPDEAVCDGPQALPSGDLADYVHAVEQAAALASKTLAGREPALVEVPAAQLRPTDYVRDKRIERVVALLAPDTLLDELPLSSGQADVVVRGRQHVQAVLERADDRLLAVVGPCSVHDPEATLEYAGRLGELARALSGDLLIAMRVYFEKPRTTTGWKGLINDPHLDGSGDVNAGLHLARRVLLGVLDTGLPVGCEFLDPITPQYIADAVSWGAIGARTTESQIHRQLGSGLSMPVGFKNRTDGNVQVAVDAVRAAAEPHAFAGIDPSGTPAILYTRGNADCHIILRGGRGKPNYQAASVSEALALLDAMRLPRRVMIDLSHDNSGKDPERQQLVGADVGAQIAGGHDAIVGVMLESFLVGGRQDLRPGAQLRYGQSITDGCIGWEETVAGLEGLAQAVRDRRAAAAQTAAR